MKDPRRLVEEPGRLSSLEQRMLSAGVDARPAQSFTKEVWAGLVASLPSVMGGSTAAATTQTGGSAAPVGKAAATAGARVAATKLGASKAIVVLGLAKSVVLGATLGTAVIGASLAVHPGITHPASERTPAKNANSARSVPPNPALGGLPEVDVPGPVRILEERSPGVEEKAAGPRRDPPPSARKAIQKEKSGRSNIDSLGGEESFIPLEPEQPTPTAEASPSVADSGSSLTTDASATVAVGAGSATAPSESMPIATRLQIDSREETRVITLARDTLRGGHAAEALALLEWLRQKYPAGLLAQEREALAIEALATSGQRAAAIQRAKDYLRVYPNSPFRTRIGDIVGRR